MSGRDSQSTVLTSKQQLIEAIIRDVCELPDYTSPDDQPNLLQCTVEELDAILDRHLQVETAAEPVSCVYIPPDDGSMWLTDCGHEHHKDGDLDLYDFCPYCGRPVEEGSSEKTSPEPGK